MNLIDSISNAMGFGSVTDIMTKEKSCELCNGEGTVKVGDFDNIKEIDCPQCSCRFCNKQNCECDNGQEN